MTNFNDPSAARIEDVSIPARAYRVIEELAEIKNRTVQETIEDLILVGLALDLENHSVLGEQYSDYLKEKYQYDPQRRWKV